MTKGKNLHTDREEWERKRGSSALVTKIGRRRGRKAYANARYRACMISCMHILYISHIVNLYISCTLHLRFLLPAPARIIQRTANKRPENGGCFGSSAALCARFCRSAATEKRLASPKSKASADRSPDLRKPVHIISEQLHPRMYRVTVTVAYAIGSQPATAIHFSRKISVSSLRLPLCLRE